MSYYTTKNWKARTGEGLNKYSIDGAAPVTIINSPDSVTQAGDALSATNLNNLEGRINEGFGNVQDAVSNITTILDGLSGGVIFKGEVTDTTDLPAASSSNIGWEYWVVNESSFYLSNGTSWVATGVSVIDSLDSTSTTKALSANQGKVLDEIKVDKDTFNALGLSVVSGAINITYTE